VFLYKLTLDNKDISKYYFYMKYLILGVIFISSSIFALDTEIESQTDPVDCLQLNKHQHLSPAESKNLPRIGIPNTYYNCIDSSNRVVKAPDDVTPSKTVNMGAAIILNPIGAAFWFIDKALRSGVNKTINQ
jgi:hypothetical protein